jgi:hypothetical protein
MPTRIFAIGRLLKKAENAKDAESVEAIRSS